jgi:DNA-binding transcriptional MerR regulator
MLTVSRLAERFGISRATVLYYEREGLLSPARRSTNGYRWYGEDEIGRLRTILDYRSFGISVSEIGRLMNHPGDSKEVCLRKQFQHLEQEIRKLRGQQQAIVNFLKHPELLEEKMVTKKRWVEIMRTAGLSDDDMRNWHRQFEKLEPEAHQDFLVSLGINHDEVEKIRDNSR